ncbi:hypothetical protein IWQ62_004558 [Dispira parvispora]|uniref:Borealin N-terminal domain-containing protein n=1 Tax=Dispira parvispora TaxID=1520584 RepID=A0A9W8ASN8_9FUNG|nr:hypothetical protein IWQ62_004558 [Dispira parvispora]
MATTAKRSTRRAADSISSDTDVESCRDPKSPCKRDMSSGLVALAQGGPSSQEAPLSSQSASGLEPALPKSPRSATSTFQRSLFQLTNSHTLLGKLSPAEKQAMLDNLEYEVNDRVQRLRSNSKWLSESLKLRCELDLSVFPKAVRSLSISEFCLVYKGSVNEYMHQEAARRIQQFALPRTPEILKKRKFTESDPPLPIPRNLTQVAAQTGIPTPVRQGSIVSSVQSNSSVTPSNSRLKQIPSLKKDTPGPVVSVAVFSPKISKSPFTGQNLRLPLPPSAKKLARVITRKSPGPRNAAKANNRKATRANARSTRRAVQTKSSSDSLAAEKPNKRIRRESNSGRGVQSVSSKANKENVGTNETTSETGDGQIGGKNTRSKRKSHGNGSKSRKSVTAKNDNGGGGEESNETNTRSKVVPPSRPATTTRAADRAALALYSRNNEKVGVKSASAVGGAKPAGASRKSSRKKMNAKT